MASNKNTTNLAVLGQQLSDHIVDADKKFIEVGNKIDSIGGAVKEIKDNHLDHLKGDVNDIKISLSKNSTDTDWLKRFFFIVAGASIGALVTGILTLIFK